MYLKRRLLAACYEGALLSTVADNIRAELKPVDENTSVDLSSSPT